MLDSLITKQQLIELLNQDNTKISLINIVDTSTNLDPLIMFGVEMNGTESVHIKLELTSFKSVIE